MKNIGVAFLLVIFACVLLASSPAAGQQRVIQGRVIIQQQQEEPAAPDGEGEKEEPAAPKPPVDDKSSQVFMQDGTYMVGQIDVDRFEIETEYGKLIVPRSEIIKVTIGKNANKELKKTITGLIEKLGDQEFKTREEASKELEALGTVALQELRMAAKSDDIEVKTRAEKIVKDIESSMAPDAEIIIDDDEIETRKFTIRGTLLVDEFAIKTKYGTMKAQKKDIKSIVVSQPSGLSKSITVNASANSGSSTMKDSGIDLKKGDKVTITASGTVYIRNWGINVSPDGDQSYGQHFPGIPAGALMGKIGQSGTLFLIGSSYTATADRDGRLYFGIAVRDRYSNTGDFRAKVEVEK